MSFIINNLESPTRKPKRLAKARLAFALAVPILGLLALQVATGQDALNSEIRAGNVAFKVPAGWQELPGGAQGGPVILTPNPAPGLASTLMVSTYPINTDLKTTLNEIWTRIVAQNQVQHASAPSELQIAGHRAMSVGARLSDGKETNLAMLTLIENGSSATGVLFLTNQFQLGPAFDAQKAALMGVLSSIRFADQPGAGGSMPAMPAASASQPGAAQPLNSAMPGLATFPQSNPGETQIGDFHFMMPAGWTHPQAAPPGVIQAPPATPGKLTFITFSTKPMQGDLKSTYQSQLADLQKTYRVQPQSEPVMIQAAGSPALTVSAILTTPQGAQLACFYLLVQNGNRAEGILYTTNDTDPGAIAAHNAALQSLVAGLHFSGGDSASAINPNPRPAAWSAPQTATPASFQLSTTPGGPPRFSAIFRAAARNGEDPTANLAITNPAAKTPNFKYLVFFGDGRVKRGLIQSGFADEVPESSMRLDIASGGKFATQWGMYQLAGGRGMLQFASAIGGQQLVRGLNGEAFNVVEYQDHLEVNGEVYLLLDCPNGLQLNGVYKPYGDTNAPGIRFTPDGQFTDEGIFATNTAMAIGVAGGGVVMGYGFAPPRGGPGSYSISGYGLHLHYATSQSPSPLFFIEPGNSPNDVRVLYIGNVRFQRVQ